MTTELSGVVPDQSFPFLFAAVFYPNSIVPEISLTDVVNVFNVAR